ncbi:porin [Ideonella sp. A 288]|uniref:porin n=1 Tax=Ideonella sp. A 288 TaxID=1962181 RepID=UPI000B4B452E|nr:porin [Ideonella sp. A 288]
MKKSLLALAVIGFAGAASAQSSVTLFGIVDAAYGHVSAGGRSASGITNSGLNSSRLGFRGVEDLGGGMKAAFHLEGQLDNDTGTGRSGTAASGGGLNFQRRSTVSLLGGFGEVRIGRDYSPNFWNTTIYDPFGTNGVGQSLTPAMLANIGTGTNSSAVRTSNSISYFTPAMGGIGLQVMKGFGENAGGVKTGNYMGFRAGYAAGPLSVDYSYAKTEGATDAADTKYSNIGASFDLGMVKPQFIWAQEKTSAGAKIGAWQLGLTAPMGQGEFRAAYSRYDVKNSANDWNKFALGYGYNLSKRTQLYTTYARVSNKGAQVVAVSNNGLSAGAAAAGGNSTGYEFGVRHSF